MVPQLSRGPGARSRPTPLDRGPLHGDSALDALLQYPTLSSRQFCKGGGEQHPPISHMRTLQFRKCKWPAHSKLLSVTDSGRQLCLPTTPAPLIRPPGPTGPPAPCSPHTGSAGALLPLSTALSGPRTTCYCLLCLGTCLGFASPARGRPGGPGRSWCGLLQWPSAPIKAWPLR